MEANNKVMLDALLKVKRLFDGQIMFQQDIREAHKAVNAALAAPPRNCERFETAEDAKKEFNYLWNFVWKRGGGYFYEREYWGEYDKWLFAPATENEGDAK